MSRFAFLSILSLTLIVSPSLARADALTELCGKMPDAAVVFGVDIAAFQNTDEFEMTVGPLLERQSNTGLAAAFVRAVTGSASESVSLSCLSFSSLDTASNDFFSLSEGPAVPLLQNSIRTDGSLLPELMAGRESWRDSHGTTYLFASPESLAVGSHPLMVQFLASESLPPARQKLLGETGIVRFRISVAEAVRSSHPALANVELIEGFIDFATGAEISFSVQYSGEGALQGAADFRALAASLASIEALAALGLEWVPSALTAAPNSTDQQRLDVRILATEEQWSPLLMKIQTLIDEETR